MDGNRRTVYPGRRYFAKCPREWCVTTTRRVDTRLRRGARANHGFSLSNDATHWESPISNCKDAITPSTTVNRFSTGGHVARRQPFRPKKLPRVTRVSRFPLRKKKKHRAETLIREGAQRYTRNVARYSARVCNTQDEINCSLLILFLPRDLIWLEIVTRVTRNKWLIKRCSAAIRASQLSPNYR